MDRPTDSTVIRKAPVESPALQATALPPGTVIAGRFTLESQAGRGGMGAVYRARDAHDGRPVALKLLHVGSPEALSRFHREATLLAGLRHPGVVGYVAHGTAENELPFLAMEWLDGEDLASRLARQPLNLEESLALLRRAAEALAVAHQDGVIHRDVKPSNLFLRDKNPGDVVLLDFGLARDTLPTAPITASQLVIGTPGYMAPEQASGHPDLTPGVDIFSLGCVLYECLTGQPPFSAPHLVAALAKILFTDPAPLRSLRPELPSSFQHLLERMLAKDLARRLPDADHLLKALAELQAGLTASPTAASPSEALPHLGGAEQQLVSVLLAVPRISTGERRARETPYEALRSLTAAHGARVELLADGSVVITLVASHGSAADPATLAARCALSLQEHWPEAGMVLTTGRGQLERHLPVGEAMDRAGQLLRQLEVLPPDSGAPVLLDEVTAGLLGPGFQISRAQPGLFLLHGAHLGADQSRPLLGKPTPCVGREQELAMLELAFTTCAEESAAQAMLVTAPAGVGKSRLRHEFLRRLERHAYPPLVLYGSGEPMSADSADGLLGQALRRLCGAPGGEPLEARRARVAERLARHLPAAQASDVIEFLGELCGTPSSDEPSPKLRAARGDPRLMSTHVGRALVAFLKAECAQHPVMLVLENLQWGDVLSVRLMGEALRELADHRFMVLALARPEVEPLLAADPPSARRLQQVPLRGLNRKAGARLAREILGGGVPDSVIDRIVEQAAGNALFLEELIRGAAEGRGEAPPETVLAMVQARLMHLEPNAREVLLAASVFGRTFWSDGVRALLGGRRAPEELENQLQRLIELEWVEPQPTRSLPRGTGYRFRHALVRDAAYGLLPDSHKPTGHRLAGGWLEQAGESEPRVLAEHAALGQQPERAVQFYIRAAHQRYERHDMPGTVRCIEAALALGAQGEGLVRLRALQATTAFWTGDLATLFATGPGALAELPPGGLSWFCIAHCLYSGYVLTGQQEKVPELLQLFLRTRPDEEARVELFEALALALVGSAWSGDREESSTILSRILELRAEAGANASVERAWADYAQSHFSFFFESNLWLIRFWAEQAYRGLHEIGLERMAAYVQVLWALTLQGLGDEATAEVHLRESLALTRQLGQTLSNLYPGLYLGQLLAGSAEPSRREEARALANELEPDCRTAMLRGLAYVLRAKLAMGDGDPDKAQAEARQAGELLAPFRSHQRVARALRSQALLAQGRAAEAREEAALGVQTLEACGGEGAGAVALRLALAEACLATGDEEAGDAALRRAVQSLREGARDIPDEARERFLRQVPENARVLELARQRWGAVAIP